ncbi:MAG TPA: inositol monophosphatase family protein [Verrucomicrobiales bacterium]|nr:inositol monophosphatase family protein [Verrucomicrobiales bacterium]
MTTRDRQLATAVHAARDAGTFLRQHYEGESELLVNETTQHDIKLDLDVRSQERIAQCLLEAYPGDALLGEEGVQGNSSSARRWVVDPIDGTVNYFYGIPHFCVSIALEEEGDTVLGVIYDPMLDEVYTATDEHPSKRNGNPIHPSSRKSLSDAVITVGFSKTVEALDLGFDRFRHLAYRVRKIRILGSAALGLSYVACGRLDAYVEEGIGLWDIAAGVLLVHRAGGQVELTAVPGSERLQFGIIAANPHLDLAELRRPAAGQDFSPAANP